MKIHALNESDLELLRKTAALLKDRGSRISGVAAGLRTEAGREFYGLCIDATTATVGICAEYSAIGAMVTAGEMKVTTIVAVVKGGRGFKSLPPCGKCRDLVRSFGNPYVILPFGGRIEDSRKARLSDLMPHPWK